MSHPVLEVLALPQYRRLASGSVALSFAEGMEQLLVAWLIFDQTGSALITALAWSARSLPRLLLGALAGVYADRYPRDAVMFWNALARSATLLVMAAAIVWMQNPIPVILAMTAAGGFCRTQHMTASQSLATQMVADHQLATASSFLAFAQRLIGPLSVVGTGFALTVLPAHAVVLIAAGSVLVAAVQFGRLERVQVSATRTNVIVELREGMQVFLATPVIAQLLGLMMVVEILAFAFRPLLPVLASEAFGVGPDGLGLLEGSAGVGAIIGLALLSAFAGQLSTGRMLLAVTMLFGVLLTLLGLNQSFGAGLAILVGIGIAASLVDAIEWALLQANVQQHLRGRVLGAWSLVIGFGWIGPILVGGAADLWGYSTALCAIGLLVFTFGLMCCASRTLRAATTVGRVQPNGSA